MNLRHIFHCQNDHQEPHRKRKTLPLIQSPLEEKNPGTQVPLKDESTCHRSSRIIKDSNADAPLKYSNAANGNDDVNFDTQMVSSPTSSSVPNTPLGWANKINIGYRSIQLNTKGHEGGHEPHFKVHHEASSIELFYDLFFVANLATFTSNHPINDKSSLASYMSFFTLLWFTWFQTSLYDVRFSIDSVFSRICKALHFGVMVGFAILDPSFDTESIEEDNGTFRSLSIILMVSRLILFVQYGSVLWFVKDYKRTVLPVALLMIGLLTTAMVFLGITFAFGPERGGQADTGWYMTVVVEAVLVLGVSGRWRILRFKRTHLVERVGLLTLIILGEGIIGMTKSVTKIMHGTTSVTGSSIGTVICSVLIIYFLYMLYYDQIDHDRFGTIRQQVWAILHFPLYVGMLLTVEGSSEFILWRLGVELETWALKQYDTALNTANNSKEVIDAVNSTTQTIATRFTNLYPMPDFTPIYAKITALNFTKSSSNATYIKTERLIMQMGSEMVVWIFKSIGITVPYEDLEHTETPISKLTAIGGVFKSVYSYFFVAAGLVLVMLSFMYWFGKKGKSRGEILSILVLFWFGLGLSLVTIMPRANIDNYGRYVESPWILPTVVLSYGLVITLDNVFIYLSNRHISQAKQRYKVETDAA